MRIAYGRASFKLNANSLNSLSMRFLICIRVDRPLFMASLYRSSDTVDRENFVVKKLQEDHCSTKFKHTKYYISIEILNTQNNYNMYIRIKLQNIFFLR